MSSTFAWLDFSDRDRKRALDAVDAFREEDTRDELGLGVIRDAFADRLFPGTSTIQTRIRYFLFIPWLFRRLSAADREPDRFALRVRQLQDQLRKSLIKGDEAFGVIGFRAGGNVQRLPSSVYWQGLRRLGVLRFRGSEADYARELRPGRGELRNDDGEQVGNPDHALWDPQIPEPPDGLLDASDFNLSREEAQYLADRVNFAASDSLLAHLIHLGRLPGNAAFPWEHVSVDGLPRALGEELGHARNFSECMHGSSLLYNFMLAQEKGSEDVVGEYEGALAEWWERLKQRSSEIAKWDRTRFWALFVTWRVKVPPPSYSFVETWLSSIGKTRRIEDILADRSLRELIRLRESFLKRGRARLGNPRALDLWNGRSGVGQLDYRWSRPVRQMLDDLIRQPASET